MQWCFYFIQNGKETQKKKTTKEMKRKIIYILYKKVKQTYIYFYTFRVQDLCMYGTRTFTMLNVKLKRRQCDELVVVVIVVDLFILMVRPAKIGLVFLNMTSIRFSVRIFFFYILVVVLLILWREIQCLLLCYWFDSFLMVTGC